MVHVDDCCRVFSQPLPHSPCTREIAATGIPWNRRRSNASFPQGLYQWTISEEKYGYVVSESLGMSCKASNKSDDSSAFRLSVLNDV